MSTPKILVAKARGNIFQTCNDNDNNNDNNNNNNGDNDNNNNDNKNDNDNNNSNNNNNHNHDNDNNSDTDNGSRGIFPGFNGQTFCKLYLCMLLTTTFLGAYRPPGSA